LANAVFAIPAKLDVDGRDNPGHDVGKSGARIIDFCDAFEDHDLEHQLGSAAYRSGRQIPEKRPT
jgi:hypothetical protein